MEASIKAAHPDASVQLIPGGGGDFIVIADGQELWNKREKNGDQFPEDSEIVAKLGG